MKVKELIALLQQQDPESRVMAGLVDAWPRVYPGVVVQNVLLDSGPDAQMEAVVSVSASPSSSHPDWTGPC